MRRLHAALGATYYLDDSSASQGPLLVKVLDAREPDAARLLELENELRVTRDLAIPGVRRALRRGEVEGRAALWSTFFAGETIAQTFVAVRQPLERVLEVALRIADVIGALHAARVVHGQLSPDAIRVDSSFREIELAELGLASRGEIALSEGAISFAADPRAAYASPEQTGRMNRPVDWRTDLCSLGAILHAMLTGRAPYADGDRLELVHQLIALEPPRVHELAPGVPEVVSEIVAKLLAKNAEDRYQSAEGLRADLARCLDALRASGSVAPFQLATKDTATRFQLARKLYGRDAELATLLDAAERTRGGASELVLVAGPAGIGKTALVHEVHRPLAARRGRFIEGKFDQYQQELPFSAFTHAFEQWVHLVLSESEDELARERERVCEAVGDLGGLMTQLVPDLELVIGPQPGAPELGPSEALNRFQYVLRRFVGAIADEHRPLVVFVDDLQWADPGSLQLLGTLIGAREARHLLIVGAYRDNEVVPGHPFQVALDAWIRDDAPVSSIVLGPLSEDALEQLVADALSDETSRVASLARFVAQETGGNALFVGQLLRSMDEEGVLRFHPATGRWEWDLRTTGGPADERRDVLDLIVAKARKLPDATREALIRGACLGNRFDARALATILGRPIAELAGSLAIAIREGLLIPAGVGHRYVEADVAIGDDVEVAYVFPHDRIQQAIYSLVPDAERAALHLAVGRALRDAARDGARVFDVAHQLNRGREAMRDPAERRRLAELNLEAALVAKRAAAYAASLSHLTIGIELLGDEGSAWARDPALSLTLHTEAAECAYLSAALDRMERHTDVVLAHGRSILETIRVYNLRVDAYTSQNRLHDAMRVGREALAALGVAFPDDPRMHHILVGLARTKLRLARKDVPALARQRRMTDPHKLEAMLLLERMVPPAYMSGSPLFPLLVFAMVDLSVKYGNSPLSPFGYGSFAITLSGVLGDIRSGETFGRMALDAMQHLGAETFKAKIYFVLYVFIEHWTKHLASCEAPLLEAFHSGMRAGNLVGATWSAFYRLLWMHYRGRSLPELEREAATYAAIFDQLKQNAAFRRTDMMRQVLLNLMGRTRDPITFGGEAYSDDEVAQLAERGDDATSRFFYHYNKGVLCYSFGRFEDAVVHGDRAAALLESVTGLPDLPFWSLWDGLARVRASESASGKRKRALLATARAHSGKLAKWGSFGPMNYQHKHDLLAAELARAGGDARAARELYDRAIDGATRNGYVHEAALAQELAARFHLREGRRELGAWYLESAHDGYVRWGAMAKVEALEAEHPSVLVHAATFENDSSPGVDALDLASVVKATTAISGEIVLDRLAAKMLEILVENAGAERGALVLHEAGRATVIAHKPSAKEPVRTGLSEPVESGALLPEPVLAYVARTKRSLLVDDALAEPRFARDRYVVRHRVRSILCAPILHQGDLRATVYLENNLAPRAFTLERIALFRVLGGQIAISLENAKLYRDLTHALDQQKELTHAYSRFTPSAFLDHLGHASILDVKLGDHRHGDMTVVFLDIRAYTTLSESMSEGDNFAFINGFLSRMTPAIGRHHGVVSEFMGDGIMSFFPRRPEDALDACIEMQRAVRAYNVERRSKGRREIAVGMGVHTGPLMIGIIGDRDRMSTALVSDTVNTAARMEGLTKEFQVGILASERTVSRIDGAERYGFRHIGDVRVKGKSEVIRVFECTGGDDDASARSKHATRATFLRGLERWRDADFRGAADAFGRVLEEHGTDGTARRYLERSTEYLAHGSPADWSGVETIDRK